MKVGDKIVFIKHGWATLEYGSIFTILDIDYLDKKCFMIFDGNGKTYVRSKNFKSLKKLRKKKLEKLNEGR